MTIVHHHLLYQAEVGCTYDQSSEKELESFLYEFLKVIGMECLIPAQLKFSHQKAWTGMVGIVTSHVAFHYWTEEKYVQFDVYSCKEFDKKQAVEFLNDFWNAKNEKVLFIDREVGKSFNVRRN